MSGPALRTRPAAVAGQFYPGRARDLAGVIDEALADAARDLPTTPDPATRPKALIVPHAGYIYSGPVAATAYARLLPWRDGIERVVLLGPAHRVYVESMAVSSADRWETPLGPVPLDREALATVLALPGVVVDDRAHAPEHSLEVHVPFLQRAIGDGFRLVPVVVGAARRDEVADVLDAVWGGDETLIVISTDLSHYHDQSTARRLDRDTATAILAGDVDAIEPARACGAYPVRGMLTAASRHGLTTELVDLRNSGDTAGPADRVVGYGAFVLAPRRDDAVAAAPTADTADTADTTVAASVVGAPPAAFDAAERRALLDHAIEEIRARLEGRRPHEVAVPARLREPGASFVTLREGERLLGCIGSLEPVRPLIDDVADNALGAAFRDPRMPPLTRREFAVMSVHISVLTPAEPVAVSSLDQLRTLVRPGVDGLIIEAGRHRATYLPSVWEQLPDVDDFLDQLWRKAGLRPGTWPAGLRVARYQTVEFGDDGPRAPIGS